MADSKPEEEAPKKKSKLPIIIIAVVLLLGGGGGAGWFFFMKPKADEAHAEAGAEDSHAEESPRAERRPKRRSRTKDDGPRLFVTLEPFVVNLNDPEQDRFAQIGVVFEVEDNTVEADINAVTPAIRDAMMMLITSKTAKELLTVQGKKTLAQQMVLATNAILDGDAPPPIVQSPDPAAAPAATAHGGDPANRFAPPETQAHAPGAPGVPGTAQPGTHGAPPNPYGVAQGAYGAYGAPPGSPYGEPNPYYGAPPAFDAYGRPIPASPWNAAQYDYPERVETAHFSSFIIQ